MIDTLAVIPRDLQERKQWLLWQNENGTKVPKRIDGTNGSSTDASGWRSFSEVVQHKLYYSGIAFVISSDDPYAGIDLDNCIDEQGELRDWALPIVDRLRGISYGEVSPSGRGIKFIVQASKPAGARCTHKIGDDKQQIECYDHARFWTITGNVYEDYSETGDGQAVIDWLCATYLSGTERETGTKRDRAGNGAPLSLLARAQRYVDAVPAGTVGTLRNTAFSVSGHLHAFIGEYGERLTDGEVLLLLKSWDARNPQRLRDSEIEEASVNGRTNGAPPADKVARETSSGCSVNLSGIISGVSSAISAATTSTTTADPFANLRLTYGIEEPWSLRKMLDTDIVDKYLIEDCIVEGQPGVIAGSSKTLKTTVAVNLLLSLASGKPFIGRFKCTSPKRVFFATAESGKATTKKTVVAMANAMRHEFEPGIDLDELAAKESISLAWWVPKASNAEMLDYFIFLVDQHKADVVIIDPLYQALDDQQSSVVLNGQQLAALSKHILSKNATPILIDHAKRSSQNAKEHLPLELEDITGAGKAEFFRQWMLLSRRSKWLPKQSHELWLTIGGSAGHASQWALDVDEQNPTPTEREYGISSKTRYEAENDVRETQKSESKSKADQRTEATEARLRRKADELIDNVFGKDAAMALSQNDIAGRLSVSNSEANRVIGILMNGDRIKLVPNSARKNGRQYDGYMLSDSLPMGEL